MKAFKFTIEGNEFISAVSAAAFALNKRDKNARIGMRMDDEGLMIEAGNGYFSVNRFILLKNDDCPCFNFSLPLKEVLKPAALSHRDISAAGLVAPGKIVSIILLHLNPGGENADAPHHRNAAHRRVEAIRR